MSSFWWSAVVEPLLWTTGIVMVFAVVRWMLLDFVLDTLGGPPARPWWWRGSRQTREPHDTPDFDSSSRARMPDTRAG